jgi:heme-degrading monooxygenase HmoA
MIVAVFRNRLRPEAADEYRQWAPRMGEIAASMPGYIVHKGFAAEDGERLTYVEFESEAALHAWTVHPEHIKAKVMGRKRFFSDYDFKVCTVLHQGKSTP